MSETVEILSAAGGNRLAVVGLGLDMPGCPSTEALLQAVFLGSPLNAGGSWSMGGSLARAAGAALQEAEWQGRQLEKIAFSSCGPGLQVQMARKSLGLSGLGKDFSGNTDALPAMLRQAQEWLDAGAADAVLLGGSFGTGSAGISPVFGFDQAVHTSQTGSGAVALLIMRVEQARQCGLRIYAAVEALAYGEAASGVDANLVGTCAQAALRQAGLRPEQVGYLEACASGEDALDQAEIEGLCQAYPGNEPVSVVGSVQAKIGSLGPIHGLTALLHAALCLANRIRPGYASWSGPKFPETWLGSGFYFLSSALTWFHPQYPGSRIAAVSLVSRGGKAGHLILSWVEERVTPQAGAMRATGQQMVLVQGGSAAELAENLENLRGRLQAGEALPATARRQYEAALQNPAQYRLALLGRSSEEILREIEFAARGAMAAFEKGSEWQTPAGSYFSARPLGPDSQIAFVYPGAFNSYIGVGKDLFFLFPDLYDRFTRVAEDVGASFCEDQLYPRSQACLKKEDIDRLEASLLDDAFSMMMSGVSVAAALTMVFRDIFQTRLDAAFGYSLGENSMMFSLGVWADGNRASLNLKNSPLFHTHLAGTYDTVREYWGMPPASEGETAVEMWANHLLMVPPDRVNEALRDEPKVFLTHINTPRQVVIAGDPAACKRVIERLKCSSLRAPFNYVLHCKAMESEYPALYKMHTWPVQRIPECRIYSASEERPFVMTDTGIAATVARDLCSPLDFNRLVQRAYADGARIFIELGAGSNCAKWIDDILRGQTYLSISANRKGVDDAASIYRVLARLASHGVKLNLAPIYQA